MEFSHLEGVQSKPTLRGRNRSPWLLSAEPSVLGPDPPSGRFGAINGVKVWDLPVVVARHFPYPSYPWDERYIYLHLNHKYQRNVGKYTMHGSYGICTLFFSDTHKSSYAKSNDPIQTLIGFMKFCCTMYKTSLETKQHPCEMGFPLT